MSKRILLILSLLILLAMTLAACGGKSEPTSFHTSSTKADVDIRSMMTDEGDAITFFVYSPSGIGDASFTLTGGEMPGNVHVRLYVKGLENLELSYDDVKITASVPTSGGPTIEKVSKGGSEQEINASSPYWIDIRPLPAETGGVFVGKMMQGPSFLITLPEDFGEQDATEFSLNWVDFYR